MPGGANQIGSGYIFNSGDDIGFLGEDSVYLGGSYPSRALDSIQST